MYFHTISEAGGESLFDYYPNLGTKTIVIRGEDANKEPLNGGKVKAELIYPPPGWDISKEKITLTPEADMVQGRAEIKLTVQPDVTPKDLESIELKFTYLVNNVDNGSLSGTWTVRNNSNVKMGEVLAGQAVFVFDDQAGPNHAGVTPSGVTNVDQRYFDFVQELLNQVVTRKRDLVNVPGSIVEGKYSLITEDGKYDTSTRDALNAFKTNFGMATRPFGNTLVNFRIVDNQVVYEDNDDTTPIFRKLTKDYNHRTNPIATAEYLHQIIDQGTLVGTRDSDQDVYINGIPANAVNDTGLYELYKNVVKKFVDSMIHLCESYRDHSQPINDINGWVSRITSGVTYTMTGSPQPVSYSYGGRRTIRQFNDEVSKHGAPNYTDVQNNNSGIGVYQQYQGNILDAGPNVTNPLQRNYGIVGGGSKKWPGLIKDPEYNVGNGNPNSCWYWPYWTGIDCIGLTLQALRYAERPEDYAANQLISDPVDLPIPGIRIADVCCKGTGAWGPLHHPDDDWPGILYNTNVDNFFNQANRNLLYYWQPNQVVGAERLIHKGDFIKYGSTHITNVYSERWGESNKLTDYDIIHAYGGQFYFDQTIGANVFSRKVIVTGNNLPKQGGGLLERSGFGRIKLWD